MWSISLNSVFVRLNLNLTTSAIFKFQAVFINIFFLLLLHKNMGRKPNSDVSAPLNMSRCLVIPKVEKVVDQLDLA